MNREEKQRLDSLLFFENQVWEEGYRFVVGIDEVGRGPLAGPVVAASCFIPKGVFFEGLNDSKKLTPKKREKLFDSIVSQKGVAYGIGVIDESIIDDINIYQATLCAMKQAIDKMPIKPDYLLIDGLAFTDYPIASLKIIKGDAKSQSIAAASVLAKVIRDEMMRKYHKQWPLYGFDKHKGYGTAKHLAALAAYGPAPIHRKSFEPLKSKLSQNLSF